MQTTLLVLLIASCPAHAFTNLFSSPRASVALNAKQNAFSRDLRFKGAVAFRPVQETSYFEGSELSSDKKVRAQQLVEAAVNVAKKRDGDQKLFIQTVTEVATSLGPLFAETEEYYFAFKHMLEPEQLHQFRVPWVDDAGRTRVQRGFRVQFSSALGPYKGGLRYHPSVGVDTIKFLGFEQVFKNALTTLNLGGGKGGSDFDPKGKSEAEIMRFCQSFMTALEPYIGPNRDVPAGDIGVGGREIGYLFGQYKRLNQGRFEGVLTGKSADWGGSYVRPEATGWGCVFFAEEAMRDLKGEKIKNKRCALSGSGNVATFAAQQLLKLGAVPVTFSDSSGTIYEPEGFTAEKLDLLMKVKAIRGARLTDYAAKSPSSTYHASSRPWCVVENIDLAFPCATQNELDEQDASSLIKAGCTGVFEGANMPTTPGAVEILEAGGCVFGPAKAANAGGVAVSGLEMAQNAQMVQWTEAEVEAKLRAIMIEIYHQCADCAETYHERSALKEGANIAGFLKVAAALREQGAV
mmetsp:Transcript_15332/g.30531  ORF Transcript_15332/g.30531 Transcript_15332/m.30531 type:complete len:521 (+) Transcript_15332:70-1632(+)|eukprot:CAMPEP_0182464038 /NCGR_PEP_ID=MMETSP1319-20130603/8201_1 /TAXON_ID=172717 /ORGANISM="Bolidomonas pacifica, Strain RCC208" /LENGTH=520 /DNA_ID=CAMNT_0024663643 /DNA_START=53 /DNA_END=1615 /DNA_ORIENTATION=-